MLNKRAHGVHSSIEYRVELLLLVQDKASVHCIYTQTASLLD